MTSERGEAERATHLSERALDLFKRLGAKLDIQRIQSARANGEENQTATAVLRLSRSGSKRSADIFNCLSEAFIEDYYSKRLSTEVCGWRSLTQIARSTKIPLSDFYHTDTSRSGLKELEGFGLVESRVFLGQRGRGGKITRLRVAYEREEVKQYVSKKAQKRSRAG